VTTYNPLKSKETYGCTVVQEFFGCKGNVQKLGDFSDHTIQALNGIFVLYFNSL
jgi:hypothetical protein